MFWLLFAGGMVLLMLAYFSIARKFNIVDIPNHRSSHDYLTIRGGGIIFPLSLALASFFFDLVSVDIILAVLLIASVSFIDDIRPLPNRVRILAQFAAVGLMFAEVQAFDLPIWLIALAFVIIVGTINAYNFMDGINGITVLYSLVTFATLYYLNLSIGFAEPELFAACLIPLGVFAFFNVRRRAKCFAGDVGSISIAYMITYFIILLILHTNDISYIGLLLIYGLDTVTTIAFRLYRRENIFDAHRSHFYQYLTNIRGWGHIPTALLYAGSQIVVNIIVVSFLPDTAYFVAFLLLAGLGFLRLRFSMEGRGRLLTENNAGINT